MAKQKRPGIILYYEFAPAFRRMRPEQVYQLVIAALDYGETRKEPQIDDPVAEIIWPLLREKIDTNEKRYEDTCVKNSFNAYMRWCKEKGDEPLPFEEWYATVYESCQPNLTKPNLTKPNPNVTKQERKGVQGETRTELGSALDQAYKPPDVDEWNRLKNERTAMLKGGGTG